MTPCPAPHLGTVIKHVCFKLTHPIRSTATLISFFPFFLFFLFRGPQTLGCPNMSNCRILFTEATHPHSFNYVTKSPTANFSNASSSTILFSKLPHPHPPKALSFLERGGPFVKFLKGGALCQNFEREGPLSNFERGGPFVKF